METQTYNVLISSKNKRAFDTNTDYTVVLEDDYFVGNGEEMYVCMTQFHTIKSFYSCQSGLNDHFQIILRPLVAPNDEAVDNFSIPEGNYDVKSLMNEIIKLTKGSEGNPDLFHISYDAKVNKYLYKNLFRPDFNVYIKPITAGIFLGLENGIEYLISAQGTYSSKFINLSGYTSMVIKLEGDLNVENSVSNIETSSFRYDKVLAVLNINDKAPMDSITYENDGCLFRHKITSNKVNTFKVKIVNNDGIPFTNMADWIMILRFERVRKVNQNTMMERLLARINFYLGSMFLYFDIPVPIGLEDLRRLA